MKKSELKSGMMIVLANGEIRLVLLGTEKTFMGDVDTTCRLEPQDCCGSFRHFDYFGLQHWNEDLTSNSHVDDIVEVQSAYGQSLWKKPTSIHRDSLIVGDWYSFEWAGDPAKAMFTGQDVHGINEFKGFFYTYNCKYLSVQTCSIEQDNIHNRQYKPMTGVLDFLKNKCIEMGYGDGVIIRTPRDGYVRTLKGELLTSGLINGGTFAVYSETDYGNNECASIFCMEDGFATIGSFCSD